MITLAALVGALALSALPAHAEPLTDELWQRATSSVTGDINAAKSRTYTHIVVGCGLAGLVVATRLSENSKNTVLCIEAGQDTRTDSRVVSLSAYGQAFNSDLDWSYKTVKQNLTGSAKGIAAGKGLGGSTSINGAAWTRASKEQYDAIGALGNPGWSYADLSTFMKKAEHFYPPTSTQASLGASYVPAAHGTAGPVRVAFSPGFYTGPQQPAFLSAVAQTLGLGRVADLGAGNANGVAYTPNSLDPARGLALARSSSATAYLTPVERARPNLVVLTGWRGAKLAWATIGSGAQAKASGVYVQQRAGGAQTLLKASREVVVAAGAVASPVFLHRSGVGARALLQRLGVPVRVDLPGVGKNLQEQTMDTLGAPTSRDFGGKGPSAAIAFPAIGQLVANASAVRATFEGSLDRWAREAVAAGAAVSADGLLAQYKIQVANIFDHNAPVMELFFDSGYPNGGLGIDAWQLLPFSRGFVQASSSDAFAAPLLDPRYFAASADMDITVAGLRASRRIFQAPALKAVLSGTERTPGFAKGSGVPDNADHGKYGDWRNWVLRGNGGYGFSSVAHPIGTASMTPRAAGGVVDSKFKVYGTQNVRVVDASVLPMQISAHLSATLYGIAEKAATTISQG